MKKYLLIIGVVVVVLILAIASYFLYFRNLASTSPLTSFQQNIVSGKSKTLGELFASGKTQKCAFDDRAQSTGQVYIGDGKLRADFISTIDNVQLVTHIFYDGKTTYTWTDGQKDGLIMDFSVVSDLENPSGSAPSQIQSPRYDCADWKVDPSVFTVPALNFTKFTPIPTPTETQVNCSLCEDLTGTDKNECLKGFNCNNTSPVEE